MELNLDNDLLVGMETQVIVTAAQYPSLAYEIDKLLNYDDFLLEEHRKTFYIIHECVSRALHESIPLNLNAASLQVELETHKINYNLLNSIDLATEDRELILSFSKTIKRQSLLRTFRREMKELINNPSLDEILEKSKLVLNDIENNISEAPKSTSLASHMDDLFEFLNNENEMPEIYSIGIASLSKKLIDYSPGNVTVVAAKPNVGKTSLAALSAYVNASKNIPVHFFSLEMNAKQIAARFLSIMTGVSGSSILSKDKSLTKEKLKVLREATKHLQNITLQITTYPDMPLVALIQSIKDSVLNYGTKIVFIDYIQLINVEGRSRHEEVATIAQRLKSLALELNIAIVELSQLTRNDRDEPIMQDLKESGDIEQAASLIIMMWEDITGAVAKEENVKPVWFKVEKHRNGEKFRNLLRFQEDKMKFNLYENFDEDAYQEFKEKNKSKKRDWGKRKDKEFDE